MFRLLGLEIKEQLGLLGVLGLLDLLAHKAQRESALDYLFVLILPLAIAIKTLVTSGTMPLSDRQPLFTLTMPIVTAMRFPQLRILGMTVALQHIVGFSLSNKMLTHQTWQASK
jgi:hypothetical protein